MRPRWTLVDFVLVALGGIGGALVFGVGASLYAENELLVILSLVGQYVGHVLVIWLIGRGRSLGADSLGFEVRGSDGLYVGAGVALQIGLAVLFVPIQRWLLPEGEAAQDVAAVLQELTTPAGRIAAVVMTTLVAPLVEELMFRGVLHSALKDRSRRLVLVVGALVWAAFHLLGVVSASAGMLVFAQVFIVGLVLGHLALRHGRLGPSIFLHAGFNLVAAVFLLLPEELIQRIEEGGT